MATKFTPLTPPNSSPGKPDLPKEIHAQEFPPALDPIKPRISPVPGITYLYNKVTKYVNGSKIEFNTTPGEEYINIQHGNDLTRLTFFADGNIEIIQEEGNRLDEINGNYDIDVRDNLNLNSDSRLDNQKSYLNKTEGIALHNAARIYLSAGTIRLEGNVIINGSLKITDGISNDGNMDVAGIIDVKGNELPNPEYAPVDPVAVQDEADSFEITV